MSKSSMIRSVLCRGTSGQLIDVECTITNGLPNITIVGLGNKAIAEAKERIRSAFLQASLPFPKKRITINLAPADIPKDSTSFDLAISMAILAADNALKYQPDKTESFIGEIGLDGSIRSVRGIIGQLVAGKNCGIKKFFIPDSNKSQAQLIPGIQLVPVKNLKELFAHFCGKKLPEIVTTELKLNCSEPSRNIFQDIAGQSRAKRGLAIAAAGGHNIILNGPPGTGKSLLAKTLPGLLPPMTTEEVLQVTHLHSLTKNNFDELIIERPFRSPHHSASQKSIVGGGNPIQPGEISLSHKGVLFLDELPEFSRTTIESLRQPLEENFIRITRANESIDFPADFMLVATSNPCPCGYYGSSRECTCPPHAIQRYRLKLSGPIMDRLDLFVNVDQVKHKDILSTQGQNTNEIFDVSMAREHQIKRQGCLNSRLDNSGVKKFCHLTKESEDTLNKAAAQLNLSPRGYIRTVKVARTLADLEESDAIEEVHIAEALQYRPATNKH